jgi:putative endonuclease
VNIPRKSKRKRSLEEILQQVQDERGKNTIRYRNNNNAASQNKWNLMSYRIEKGKEGEFLVAQHLKKHGYKIIAQNYRRRFGEVDLIAQKHDTLAFVEVKWRNNPLIDPAELISISKQRKIVSVAKEFLSKHTDLEVVCRFDVALIEQNNNSINLQYIPNAFTSFD